MSKQFPLISIVTPSYNQANFLEATIQSVISQNYPNLEYIIIDGGSTDGSIEIIKKFQEYLHFWCSEPDKGQYDAINKGFTHATGEIMAWINSDDMYCPWAFRTVASIMSELPQVEWLTTLQPGGWDWNSFCSGFGSISGYSKEAFLDVCYLPSNQKFIGWIQQESTFWRRSLWQKADSYIRTDLNLAGDFDLWARFYRHEELYGTNSPLGGFRSQINQKTQFIDRYICEAMNSLSIMQELENWHPNYYREMIIYLKLNKIPKLRNILKQVNGYSGKRVVRQNMNTPNSFWEVEDYKFF
ncbi:MAG: glycosyltransferase family 2 protein [Pseudanabaena sp.]|jgi:glycosyltransferase involved in cell wall biosynthesis